MLEIENLVKLYGETHAVDGITFTAHPGVVTGFLGPNGAGKTTTMRVVLGLDKPTSGIVRVNGKQYTKSSTPLHEIGALLDAKATDKGRSARNHLRAIGATVGVGKTRVDEVLEMVGLTEVAKKSAGSFSLGMGQRLGIASALLADPSVIMLDEPVNGLDPDGILWIRHLLKQLASEGRTVFVSSHLMSEMEQTAEHLIIVGKGKVLADISMNDFIAQASGRTVEIISPDVAQLADILINEGALVTLSKDREKVNVTNITAPQIGIIAQKNNFTLYGLTTVEASLEEAFMEITQNSIEFHGATTITHSEKGE